MDAETTQAKQLIIKCAFILIIFIEAIIFGLIPQRWRRCRKSTHILSIANAFSGGVFLAIAFVHIIPETTRLYYQYKYEEKQKSLLIAGNEFIHDEKYRELIENLRLALANETGPSTAEISKVAWYYLEESFSYFPLPFVLVLAGYAFILLIDKVIIDPHSHSNNETLSLDESVIEIDKQKKVKNPFAETSRTITPMSSALPEVQCQVYNIQGAFDDDSFTHDDSIDGSRQTVNDTNTQDSNSLNSKSHLEMVIEDNSMNLAQNHLEQKKKAQKIQSQEIFTKLQKQQQQNDYFETRPNHEKIKLNAESLRKEFKKMVSRTDLFSNQMFEQMHRQKVAQHRKNKNPKLFKPQGSGQQKKTGKWNVAGKQTSDVLIENPFESRDPSSNIESLDLDANDSTAHGSLDQSDTIRTSRNVEESERQRCLHCGYLKSIILLIALTTHAVFEGIALGLTKDMAAIINLMLALAFHKGPGAISLGISLSKRFKLEQERRRALYLIILFAFATPIGIGLGMALQDTNAMVEIVMSSFAGGTFIYIAASEVIVEEFSLLGSKWIKMLFFSMGAVIITCMWLIEE